MSILKQLLGLEGKSEKLEKGRESGDTDTVRRIVAELEAIEPKRARYLAAFAYILGRVAHADLDISAEETYAPAIGKNQGG